MDESRKQFEYEAGQALNLPTSIIALARKGDGYDHAFDSMNIMQPLNGWWHWWKKSRAAIDISIGPDINPLMFNDDVLFGYHKAKEETTTNIRAAGIKVKE